MTFIQPALLIALPLAALPVIIHLIHLYRRRQVKWAAMMFLLAAQRMNKGLSRLRQVLILTMRVLAVAAIIFAVTRPLAGGWLGLTGGAPDTVMVLVDRSASLEQKNLTTGVSKRLAGLRNVTKAINDAVGTRSRLVLIDSATGKPQEMEKADALLDLPQTETTDTAADIPALLQQALDYITTNKTGRTDVWLLSDLQQSDWDASGERWERLRGAFATLQGVRFHLLSYPQSVQDDLGVTVERVKRRETSEKAELLLDLRVTRQVENPQAAEIPLRFVINGTSTSAKVTLKENQLLLQAYAIPVDKTSKRGWGRVELPGDAYAANNVYHFVFDEAPILRSIVVSEDEMESASIVAALSAAADPSHKYQASALPLKRAAEISWEDTALIVWHAPIPKADDVLAKQLHEHAAAGRAILFLPPETPDETSIFGLHWTGWELGAADKPQVVEWWRNDADLLANTRDGAALPVGTLEVTRSAKIVGDGVPLARIAGRQPLLMRSAAEQEGAVYFLGTLPGSGSSSLARDGVAMYAMLHRALNQGAQTLGKAQQRWCSAAALGTDLEKWRPAENRTEPVIVTNLALRAGVVAAGDQLCALNRPPGEDDRQVVSATALGELFAGLDFRVLTDTVESGRSLTNEVWRTFLVTMAMALLVEALLCMPPRREVPLTQSVRTPGPASPREREREPTLV
jgi:hypothetical protein